MNVGFSEWREIVDLAVDLAESENVLEGEERSCLGIPKILELGFSYNWSCMFHQELLIWMLRIVHRLCARCFC